MYPEFKDGIPYCPHCGTKMIGVQYSYAHPEHYDGVSEWFCPQQNKAFGVYSGCGLRLGRFSGKVLIDEQVELRSAFYERPLPLKSAS